MQFKLNLLLVILAVAGGIISSTVRDASATAHSPVIGKGSIVSKRVYLGRTYSRANSHKNRIDFIRSRSGK